MFPPTFKQTMVTAIAGAAMAGAVGVQNAPAMPADPVHDGYRHRPGGQYMPPPSSIAASAAKEYTVLRTPDRQTGGAPVREVAAPVEVTEPSVGFDVSSAAIGALGTGMIVIALTAGGLVWRRSTPGPQGTANA